MPETRNPLLLLDIYLDSGTQRVSSREVRSTTYTWERFVVSWGDIEVAVPSPCGPPIISDFKIRLAEPEDTRRFRDLFAHQTPRRRKCIIWALFPGESFAYFLPNASPPVARDPWFTGEIRDVIFNGDRSIEISGTDLIAPWIDEPIPALITADIYPGLDPRYEGQVLPFVSGQVRTPGIDDSPPTATFKGQIELPRMSATRWGMSAHPVAGYRIFREVSSDVDGDADEIWVEVDPSEYEETIVPKTCFGVDMNHTVIDFLEAQPDGARFRADIDGYDFRPAWGSLPAVGYDRFASPPTGTPGVALRNPIDFLINMFLTVVMAKASGDDPARIDMEGIAALRELFETGIGSPPVPLYCDYAIDRQMTVREFLSQFLTSFNLDMWQKRSGRLALNFTNAENTERAVFTETTHILAPANLSERLPDRHVNQIIYKYQYHYGEDTFSATGQHDTVEQEIIQLPAGDQKIEKDDLLLMCVRDAATAAVIASKRAETLALGSYRQSFELPLAEVPITVEPTSQVGLTHRMGLEAGGYTDREVKILSIVYDIDQRVARFRSILRVPQTIEGGLLRPRYAEGWAPLSQVNPSRSRIEDASRTIDTDPNHASYCEIQLDQTHPIATNYAQLLLSDFPPPDPDRTLVSATIHIVREYLFNGAVTSPTPGGSPIRKIMLFNTRTTAFSASPLDLIENVTADADAAKEELEYVINASDWADWFDSNAGNIWLRLWLYHTLFQNFSTTLQFKIHDCWIEYQYA